MHPLLLAATVALGVLCGAATAAEIGVTPVAVHLDKVTDRATVSVVNSGDAPVIMQVEAVEWKAGTADDKHVASGDLIINPSVFTVPAGQSQLVRVGLRRAAQADHESTYRIVLREVPSAPVPGELRVSGQVRVLMALRVPVYVAPPTAVRDARWVATQAHDGSVTANVRNDGNVHVRVGAIQLRSSEGERVGPEQGAAVVLAGGSQQFRLRGPTNDRRPMVLDIATSHGTQTLNVLAALR